MNERTCCVREPAGECHPLAMVAYSENKLGWHNERRQAKVNVRPRPSPRSTTRTLWTSHGAIHIPARPRETVMHHTRSVNANILE